MGVRYLYQVMNMKNTITSIQAGRRIQDDSPSGIIFFRRATAGGGHRLARGIFGFFVSALAIVGCGSTGDDPLTLIGQSVIRGWVSGFYEISIFPESFEINVDRLPSPVNTSIEKAVRAAYETLASAEKGRRLFLEIANNDVLLHSYDSINGTAIRTRLGDLFPPPPVMVPPVTPADSGDTGNTPTETEPPPTEQPADEQPLDLTNNWPERNTWLETSPVGALNLVLQDAPQSTDLGDFIIVTRATIRIEFLPPDEITLSTLTDIALVAKVDFPVLPVLQVQNMQRGEALPAGFIINSSVKRSASPSELGLPLAVDREGGLNLILPPRVLFQAVLSAAEVQSND